MNAHEPHYYFKQITKEDDPEYFDKPKNVICLTDLPEVCDDRYFYDKIQFIKCPFCPNLLGISTSGEKKASPSNASI